MTLMRINMRKLSLCLVVATLLLTGGGWVFPWENEPPPGIPGDFVTGGGFIFCTPSGARGNFGVGGGVKNGAFWGHLNYLDHGLGLHVTGTEVTDYQFIDDRTRDICGTATTNLGGNVCYHVRVTDNGEPGKEDIFGIRLSDCNGNVLYQAGPCDLGAPGSGEPGGGNIQLHKGNKSNTPPATPGECRA
jgi:hypothetical protein